MKNFKEFINSQEDGEKFKNKASENSDEEDYDEDHEDHDEDEDGELDFSEISWKMDKYMPEDEDIQKEYYEIMDGDSSREDKIKELVEFFDSYANERLDDYLGKQSLEDFITYLVDND
jgi:hypothetical protein